MSITHNTILRLYSAIVYHISDLNHFCVNLQNNGDVTYRGLVTATPGSSVPEPTSLEIYDTAEDTPMVGGDSKTRKVKLVNSSRQSNV